MEREHFFIEMFRCACTSQRVVSLHITVLVLQQDVNISPQGG